MVEGERQTFMGLITSLESQLQEVRKQRDSFSDLVSIQRQQLHSQEQVVERLETRIGMLEKDSKSAQTLNERREKELAQFSKELVDVRAKLAKERERNVELLQQFATERQEMERFTSKLLDETTAQVDDHLVAELKQELAKIGKLQQELAKSRQENQVNIQQLEEQLQVRTEVERKLTETK